MGQTFYSLDDTMLHSDFPEVASYLRQNLSPIALRDAVNVARNMNGDAPLGEQDFALHTQDQKRELTLEDKIREQYDLNALKSQTLVSAEAADDVKKLQSLIRTLPNTPEGEVYAKLARDLEKKAEDEAIVQEKRKKEDMERLEAVALSLGLFDGLGGKHRPHGKEIHAPIIAMEEKPEAPKVHVEYIPSLVKGDDRNTGHDDFLQQGHHNVTVTANEPSKQPDKPEESLSDHQLAHLMNKHKKIASENKAQTLGLSMARGLA